LTLRNKSSRITALVKAMQTGSVLPCLDGGERVLSELEDRLGINKSDAVCVNKMIELRDLALQSWRTGAYDMLQKFLGVY